MHRSQDITRVFSNFIIWKCDLFLYIIPFFYIWYSYYYNICMLYYELIWHLSKPYSTENPYLYYMSIAILGAWMKPLWSSSIMWLITRPHIRWVGTKLPSLEETWTKIEGDGHVAPGTTGSNGFDIIFFRQFLWHS